MAEFVSIEEELAKHGRGFFKVVGDSMEPLLHSYYSTVVIEKPMGRLKKYDVALFRRPGGTFPNQPKGRYVLHRVVEVRERDYLICGDNRVYREPVPEEWIIGVMTGFFNGETYRSCEDGEYLRYVTGLGRRRVGVWFRLLPGRVKRKLFG